MLQGLLDWREWMPTVHSTVHIVMTLILAWIALQLAHRGIHAVSRITRGRITSPEQAKRVDTIARVSRYVTAIVLGLIAGMLVLSELGVSIAPILGAAGVVGLAVGFGAQSLVKDFFSGFFLLLENQVRVGDVVSVGGKRGLVEEVTLRYVRLRDYEGTVHFVPNGAIDMVSNSTLDFAYAVVDVRIAYRENVEGVLDVMREVADCVRQDPLFGPRILSPLEVAGVDRLEESAVVLRVRFKVLPMEQWNVRREYLKRLKSAFDTAGVEIPYPHLTLYAGRGKDGTAPAHALAAHAPIAVRLQG